MRPGKDCSISIYVNVPNKVTAKRSFTLSRLFSNLSLNHLLSSLFARICNEHFCCPTHLRNMTDEKDLVSVAKQFINHFYLVNKSFLFFTILSHWSNFVHWNWFGNNLITWDFHFVDFSSIKYRLFFCHFFQRPMLTIQNINQKLEV